MNKAEIINYLFESFQEIRYVAIYLDNDLLFMQKNNASNSSEAETDRFEELLVNPALLKLAEQRGNIDCGGLDYIIVRYGNFYQLVKTIDKGHISICLNLEADVNELPNQIIQSLKEKFSNLNV